MTALLAAIAALTDVIVAPRCAGCAVAGAWLCTACRDLCEPLTLRITGGIALRAAGVHAGPLRDAIHRLKYRGERALARELGALVGALVAEDLARGARVDALVPVVAHPSRVVERGYDQAALLAEDVARDLGLPVRPVLHRIRGGTAQVSLDRRARASNVHGVFVSEARSLSGLRIALIDDVVTTGATLHDAASAARAAGARDVVAYVVAADE